MDDILDHVTPPGKIYKENSFWAATFLGGPLVAGYLFSENFKALGEPEKVKPTWIITIVSTIVIFGGVFLIPEDINIPNQVIPIAYCAVAIGLFKNFQAEKAEEHLKQGGLAFGWGRVIGVGFIGLLIMMAMLVAFGFLLYFFVDAI